MKATIIQFNLFASRWKRLGLDDDAVRELENLIMEKPSAAPVMRGTGGARKIRFAPRKWRSGKSGAVRVIYAWFAAVETVCLITAYGKNEQGNLSAAERQTIAKLLKVIEENLLKR